MIENGYPEVQYSFFVGKDQFVIRGNTMDDVKEHLNRLVMEVPDETSLVSDILNDVETIRTAGILISGVANHGPIREQAQPAANSANSANTDPYGCTHGRIRKSGIDSKTGKEWVAHYCTQPKGMQCRTRYGD